MGVKTRIGPSANAVIVMFVVVMIVGACRPSRPDQSGAAPPDSAVPPAPQQPRVPGPDQGESVPGSLLVQSANESVRVALSTDRPGGFGIMYISPNQPLDLVPWEYTIQVNNSRVRRTIRARERTTVTLGSLVVAGGESTKYGVFDSAGSALANPVANEPFDLLPGDYIVAVNGSRTPVSMREGQRTTVDTGSILVTGMEGGPSRARGYKVLDAAGQYLGGALLEEAIDLLPGDYVVDLNGSRAKQKVTVGQRSNINAGSLVVGGPKEKSFFLRTEGQTTAWGTGERVHLLPGTYNVVTADGRSLSVTIAAGQTTSAQ